MKTIEQIKTEIAQLQVDAQALKNKPKKNPDTGIALYPLEIGQYYWYIDGVGDINDSVWGAHNMDFILLERGKVHLDRKSAEQKLAAMKTEQLMRVASHKAWVEVGEEIDSKNETQRKWAFDLCNNDGLELSYAHTYSYKHPFPKKKTLEAFRNHVGNEAIINMINWLGV